MRDKVYVDVAKLGLQRITVVVLMHIDVSVIQIGISVRVEIEIRCRYVEFFHIRSYCGGNETGSASESLSFYALLERPHGYAHVQAAKLHFL